ncbi:MAG: methyl-accepting chemotaxis protein, partial [Nitrospiria bacterium]
ASESTNANVQAIASAAEEISATIGEISRSLHKETQIANEAVTLSDTANAAISKLDQSSKSIGDMVKVITSISQQTNLLALNATIEAARAGEVGKGFAVVANEVKDLANRTSKATQEIRETILEIQKDTNDAIVANSKISEVIKEIDSIATMVAGAMDEQAATTSEITRNITETAQGTEKVVKSNSAVAHASKSTAAGADSVLTAAQALSQMGAEFLELVDKFKH